ncbi:serine/threonine protein kinase [Pendulispora rubella]|uniref:Serine/threonine protein kinase n=1 Tax=Pendulispora rubella TaxID=2741070 RepID=A0ABZ2L1F0_9BACT
MTLEDRAPNAPGTFDRFGLVGTTLAEKFRVERVVAEGGFGVIYAATQLSLDVPVALKVLKTPPEFNDTVRATWIEMFAHEAKTIARLRHPNIVNILDFGVAALSTGERVPWMALEWLAGETLADALQRRRGKAGRTPAEALEFMRPVLEAVAFAHEHGIAHRDLKPANIMLLPHPRGPSARLMDFGIAKAMAEGEVTTSGETRTQGKFAAFSPQYAAPEQITRARSGPWTDVHAMALILTEVLTDRPPYDASDPTMLYAQVLAPQRPTPARRGVNSGPWEAVLTRALALRPAERYPDAGALLAALEATATRGASAPIAPAPPTVIIDPGVMQAPNAAATPSALASTVHTGPHGLTGLAPRRIARPILVLGGALGALLVLGAAALVWPHVKPKSCDQTYACHNPSQEICVLGRNVCEPGRVGVADTTVTLDGADVRHYQVARLVTLGYRDPNWDGQTTFSASLDNGSYHVNLRLPKPLKPGTYVINPKNANASKRRADDVDASLAAMDSENAGWPGRYQGQYFSGATGNITLTSADDRFGGGFEGRAELDFVGGVEGNAHVHVSMHFRGMIPE